MLLSLLKPEQLHGAILHGCQHVIAQRDNLNKINIFPVADSDTGSNMTSTAKAVINYSQTKESIHETLESIAEASLKGARGNSGMIFSQFFNGLAELMTPTEQIDLDDFKKLISQAAQSVRNALATPVEGTMLTIMETWGGLVNQAAEHMSCFVEMMQSLLPDLKQAVVDTTNSLETLKQNNVVDAGALGFYHFVQGFANFLSNPEEIIEIETQPDFEQTRHEIPHPDTHFTFRYCTEGLLRGEDIDQKKLSNLLSSNGDCVVLSGSKKVCRFHVHTDAPWEIFSKLIEAGSIEAPKVDDMLRQLEVVHKRKHNIALVTDSCADIPKASKDLYQIHEIPINIQLDDNQLLDGFSFEPNKFYSRLGKFKKYPETSLPSPKLIEEKLSYLSDHYDEVLVLSVSKELSGTYGALYQAAKKYPHVHVVNTKCTSGSQGLLVNYAGQLIAEGNNIETIKKLLNDAIDKTYLYVVIDKMDSLIRSGRINKLSGKFAKLSGIKPIITIDKDGKGQVFGKALNRKKALHKLLDVANKIESSTHSKIQQYCILHAGSEENAEKLASQTTTAFNMAPSFISSVSTAIGLHAGQGAVALAFMLT